MSNIPSSPIPSAPVRRLTLSATDRKISGVCGGIAEYFGIDATLVRVIAVVKRDDQVETERGFGAEQVVQIRDGEGVDAVAAARALTPSFA